MNLPKDSRNNHLEVISKNYFRPLFDPERFVVKEETIDNGVDFRFEIKSNYKVTGFGFNFQLKSTESITHNIDGSYSKSLETSNIEYLLNNGQPAFYGFYIDAEKKFYFTSLKKVIRDLNTKNPNWQDQANHTVRFTEKLDAESISDIYNIALTEGQMFRKIQGTLAENIGQLHSTEKIIIDTDYHVTADSDTISFIENYGLLLIDQCRWNDVIAMYKKSTAEKKVSVKYNLAVGVSFYYAGEYFKALDFLKEAYKNISHLDPSIKDYLLFFYYGIQRIMNMISEVEFDEVTKSFEENTHMFLHRELEEAVSLMGNMYNAKEYICLEFEKKINEIINNENAQPYIILSAKIQLNYYKSEQLICKLISLIAYGKIDIVQNQFDQINKQYHLLLEESKAIKSTFLNNLGLIKHSRFFVHFDSVIRRQQNSRFLDVVMPDILKNIEHTFLYFASIHHVENELFALTVLLEYYQNLENHEKIAEINTVFDRYKVEYANLDFNKKIDFTKNDGTFVSQIIRMKNDIDANDREMEILRQEMIAIDKLEQESGNIDRVDKNTIHIFPMGFFLVPKDKSDVLFEILEITNDKLKKQILNMFGKFMPVINCYVDKITKEGPLRGQLEFRGLESFRKMHKIRMALHKNGLVRTDLKFRQ
jgi:hypothetical protein